MNDHPASAWASPTPPRVLIVEDEFLVALDLRFTLEDLGYGVLGMAATVADALAHLRPPAERPDLALIDVDLGGETTAPVARELDLRRIPFAIVSGFGPDRLVGTPLEGRTVLPKPLARSALVRTLRELAEASPAPRRAPAEAGGAAP